MDEQHAGATVVIPARYDAVRLPGKAILEVAREVTGKYVVQHVYERAAQAAGVAEVIVATDDRRIYEKVEAFGGRAWMTSADHRCGTDRIAEVAGQLDSPIIVNVQGDEPQIEPEQVEQVIRLLADDERAVMGTLATPMESEGAWRDPHVVKVVVDQEGFALYFSRSPIPYVRDSDEWMRDAPLTPLHHLGIYSFRREFLLRYAAMPPAPLEQAEKLEQLRALSAGYRIKVGITPHRCIGIDTPEDLQRWLALYR
ncbi:MAG: 3-deoxy-manno-octulosonate cytidylyltransferase [Candidatus Brocadiia bacterium]|nr:3-deoxy-manno-octulosonate cytidylyltransferase [Candidatus Brocadiia bacterium]